MSSLDRIVGSKFNYWFGFGADSITTVFFLLWGVFAYTGSCARTNPLSPVISPRDSTSRCNFGWRSTRSAVSGQGSSAGSTAVPVFT
jgi:hypothetical protein